MSEPLAGIRVVDLTALLPGPLCTMHLGDLGADVIKIENPRAPDALRDSFSRRHQSRPDTGAKSGGGEPGGMFRMLNRNKRSLSLNIRRPGGRAILVRLLEKADVFIDGFRPRTLKSLKLDYETLAPDFPRLIHCSLSGYGGNGPAANRAGHDANFAALCGIIDLNRDARGEPLLPPLQIADLAGAETALSAILAALFVRERGGGGQRLDLSLFDSAFSRLALQAGDLLEGNGRLRRREHPLSGALPNYRLYRCADGRHVMLAALEPRFLRTLLRRLKREDLFPGDEPAGDEPAGDEPADDEPAGDEPADDESADDEPAAGKHDGGRTERLGRELATIFASRSRDDWRFLFEDDEVCLSPVLTLEEAFTNPQLRARAMMISGEHSTPGKRELIGPPFRFSATPCSYRLPPPAPGEHTADILTDLGYTAAEQADFRQQRLI